jgi:putative tryptophan/tyrosine transport system substrate-binding protein
VRRRELVNLIGSAAAAWPFASLRAQKTTMPVIGFLGAVSPEQPTTIRNLVGFRKGLSEAGYIDGQNVAIEYRWAEGHYDRLPVLAVDHVNRKVDVIVATGGTPSALAAKSATSTIPIVFLADSAMVTTGLANSLAKPGGNLTGFIIFGHELTPKRLELLSELVPHARVIALLVNSTKPDTERTVRDMQEAALAKGVQLPIVTAGTEGEIDAVFAALVQRQIGALVLASDSFFSNQRAQIVALASRHGIATIYDWREFAISGGLISYGISFTDSYRQLGTYAGKILNGAKPADLPVQQPTKFEMVVNLKTAKTLGLTVPPSILARADELIE